MCGIFGLYSSQTSVDLKAFERSVSLIRHRGPDDEGYLLAQTRGGPVVHCGGQETDRHMAVQNIRDYEGSYFNLALGFRRLAILDLSPLGHQPMSWADERYWIVFNGEIYNYLELRDELIALGEQFRSSSDTEVLLAAYARWGAGALSKMIGMFAFCIYDREERSLFLARDYFGIKPLLYSFENGRFVFGSELKALLPFLSEKNINPPALHAYLRYGLTDSNEDTLVAGVHHLLPGHWLRVQLDGELSFETASYWQIETRTRSDISFADAAEELRRLFLRNIQIHLRSDVPVGVALSGGVDSSSIIMSMRHWIGERVPIHSISYIDPHPIIGEEKWVDIVAAASGAETHKTRASADDLEQDIDHLMISQDEPFGSTSIYAQHRVFRLAREAGVVVMLDGQGADEMLAGYRPYFSVRAASLFRQWQLLEGFRFLGTIFRRSEESRLRILSRTGSWLIPPQLHQAARSLIGEEFYPDWMNQSWFDQAGVRPKALTNYVQDREALKALLLQAVTQISLPMLLRYEDRNSMAASIESRVPFLTPDLANFVFSLPESYILSKDAETKSVFRQAMRGLVPDVVLDRRDKIGFATPDGEWMLKSQKWVDGVLYGEKAHQIPALQLKTVHQNWEAIKRGERPFGLEVWRWVNLIRWGDLMQISF